MQTLAEVCALCNDARIEFKAGHHRAVGQPTEAALLVLAEKLGVASEVTQRSIASARLADPEANPTGACSHHASKFAKLATLEFDRDRVRAAGSEADARAWRGRSFMFAWGSMCRCQCAPGTGRCLTSAALPGTASRLCRSP